ncbi:MAG: hypothetical protein JW809_09590 [Pirellulales bacterium]|nr:hypothetical protein [Pirellulales bacterium]
MRRAASSWAVVLMVLSIASAAGAAAEPAPTWLADYSGAMSRAEQDRRMMVIVFGAPGNAAVCEAVAPDAFDDAVVRERLADCIAVRLPLDAEIRIGGEMVRLIDQPAFAEMLGRQGVAILDFAHQDAEFYGTVVNTFPILNGRPYSVRQVRAMLDLPPGTLTQRTLIYAVRTHPEAPASADGQFLGDLAREATAHSEYQARIRLQGHHQWGTRFQRIRSILPGGLTANEVVAESWPGEGLLAAAIECVRCWRLSSGHWNHVRTPHRFFAYDMKRGANGIWYATGIFSGR